MGCMMNAVRSRFTTKIYTGEKIPDQDVLDLIEVMRLAPSAVNIQPWRFLVAGSPEAKERLIPAVADFNHERVRGASHAIVIATKVDVDDAYLAEIGAREVADGRYSAEQSAAGGAGRKAFVEARRAKGELREWLSRQTYIAFGFAMMACSLMKIDATPIEGMDCERLDEILGLPGQGLHALAILSVGRHSPEDRNAAKPKSRLAAETIATWL